MVLRAGTVLSIQIYTSTNKSGLTLYVPLNFDHSVCQYLNTFSIYINANVL